jgi:hypothetical protein
MTTWLVSKAGSDSNGGTSISVNSTGTDGISESAGGLTKFTSISATWTSVLIGQAIRASSGTITRLISAVQTSQAIATAVTASGLTTFTSAGLFNSTMLGCAVSGPGIAAGTYISAYTSSSSMTLSAAAGAGFGSGSALIGPLLTTTGTTNFTAATGQTWTVGGMKLTLNQALVTTSGLKNVIAAGDQIYVGAGVYRETVVNAVSGSQLSTTYNGTNGSSLTTLGSVITLTSVTGLVAPPAGYYNQGTVVTSAGVVGFTWTGISGSTLTGVTFLVNNTVTSAATVASSATLNVSTPIWVIGDVDGAQTGAAGEVSLTTFTTNDSAVPSASTLLGLNTTTNLSFALLTFIGNSSNIVSTSAATTIVFYSFIDCTFNTFYGNASTALTFTPSTTGLALCLLIDRCLSISAVALMAMTAATTTSGSGDFDLLVLIRNSLLVTASGASAIIGLSSSAANANKPGGLRVYNCTTLGTNALRTSTASEISTTIPCEIHNSVIIAGGNNGIVAATSGQIVGSYNTIYSSAGVSNYTYGTGDVSNSSGGTATYRAPTLELGQSFKWAMGTIRQFLAPDGPSSVLLGFGSAAGSPTNDWANRPRPSGGGSASNAAGYAEFHDFGIQDTVVFPSGQSSSAKLIGPGDNDIWVPLDATSTVITIQLNQGSGYGGTTYATATLLGNGELGVASQVQTCSSTLNAWQTLTFSAITASKAGWMKVRITSYDTSGTGTLNFGALT